MSQLLIRRYPGDSNPRNHHLLEFLYGRTELLGATEDPVGSLGKGCSSAVLSVVTDDLPADRDASYSLLMFRSDT